MKNLKELKAHHLELVNQAKALQDAADAANRDLTADEDKALQGYLDEAERVQAEIGRREKLEAATARLAAPQGRQVDAAPPSTGAAGRVDVSERAPRGHWGWSHFGEYATAVRRAARGHTPDVRLVNAPTTFGTEGVGADGGFAVPPDFRQQILQAVMGEDSLLSRCDELVTTSNSITVPRDQTAPWASSGGIQAYWEGEGDQITQSKPALEQATIRVPKLSCLVPVTEELLEDAPALDGYLRAKVPEVMDFKASLAIVQGTGVGQPLGILNSPCLVTVAKETNQVADTVMAENIMKMWSRCYGPSRRNAVWLINQDVEAQLMQMKILIKNVAGTENVGGYPIYIPAGGLSSAPYGTLLGRPIVPTQACETVGDLGDIILADLGKYAAVRKASGLQFDTSMHLFFDYAMTAFRFIFRLGGQPWWSAAVSPRDGSNTLSPFVALAERA